MSGGILKLLFPHFRPQDGEGISVRGEGRIINPPVDYLLWGTGPKEAGPPIMSDKQIREIYKTLPPEDQAAITAAITQRVEAAKEKRKIG